MRRRTHLLPRALASKVVAVAVALTASTLVGGCSLVLNWSEDGLPCNEDGECFANYTCLVNECIADGSLPEGETCFYDVQCEDGLVCAPSLFTCRRDCSVFFSDVGCETGTYCKPVLDADGPECDNITNPCEVGTCESGEDNVRRCRFYQGVCVEADECSPDSDSGCPAGDVCVRVSSDAQACLTGCEITWSSQVYSDNCGSTQLDPMYCQPVGQPGSQKLVCLDTAAAAQTSGNVCDPVSQPCRPGLACIDLKCERHCNADAPAGTTYCLDNEGTDAPVCCAINDGDYALCKDEGGGTGCP